MASASDHEELPHGEDEQHPSDSNDWASDSDHEELHNSRDALPFPPRFNFFCDGTATETVTPTSSSSYTVAAAGAPQTTMELVIFSKELKYELRNSKSPTSFNPWI
ncbi:hypothetical protein OROMI_000827 [Orobanche minor]